MTLLSGAYFLASSPIATETKCAELDELLEPMGDPWRRESSLLAMEPNVASSSL